VHAYGFLPPLLGGPFALLRCGEMAIFDRLLAEYLHRPSHPPISSVLLRFGTSAFVSPVASLVMTTVMPLI
jgi:hypothetical protein